MIAPGPSRGDRPVRGQRGRHQRGHEHRSVAAIPRPQTRVTDRAAARPGDRCIQLRLPRMRQPPPTPSFDWWRPSRRAARERGGPLPSVGVADALLDERRELTGLPRLTRCLVNP